MLQPADFKTATWRRHVEALTVRLRDLREQNDLPQDELKTAAIRGRIAEVKQLLSLSEDSLEDESHPVLRGDDE